MALDSVPLARDERRKKQLRDYYQRTKTERLAYGHAYYNDHKSDRATYYQLKKAGLWTPLPRRNPQRAARPRKPRAVNPPIAALSLEQQAKRRQRDRAYWNANKATRNAQRRARTASGMYKRSFDNAKETARTARRRAQKLTGESHAVTKAQWQEILERSDYRCVYCKKRLAVTAPYSCDGVTQDHLIALGKPGGRHTVQNVLPACRSCNAKKGRGTVLAPVQPFLLTVAS